MISLREERRAGVPLVVVETSDPSQTIRTVVAELNGKQRREPIPLLQWDYVRAAVPLNDEGGNLLSLILEGADPRSATVNPVEFLLFAGKIQTKAMVFMHNAHRFWTNEQVMQGIWNLRDQFTPAGAMMVLLCNSANTLPEELKPDVVIRTDSLPTMEEIKRIAQGTISTGKTQGMVQGEIEEMDRIEETLLGLSAFGAEQALSLSFRPTTIDRAALWETKRRMIEATPGLSVWQGGERFEQVGGNDNIKTFLRRFGKGKRRPGAICFIDEIEKTMAGSQSDSSGVSQDYLREILTFMQDTDAMGLIFIGPPGSGKSAVAKAAGNEMEIPTISLDLGGMKASLVGQSEERLRNALQVISAVSQGRALFIATCNSIGTLPPELRRRFSLGTFFFPLPNEEERQLIWKIYERKYGIRRDEGEKFSDAGWTGAEIRNCSMMAWQMDVSLKEASKNIVPVSIAAGEMIDRLCREAHGRYISASKEGMYQYEKLMSGPIAGMQSGSRKLSE